MRVATISGFAPYWGVDLNPNILDATEGKTIGGGEEAALRAASELSALGHEVTLWWCGLPGKWRGVEFRSTYCDLHSHLRSIDYDAVVSFSDLRALEWAPKSAHGRRFFAQQLNDLWNIGDWSAVDCIISPSDNHGRQLNYWGWRKKPYAVVHNGCDVEVYRSPFGWMPRDETPRGWHEGPSEGIGAFPPWDSRPLNVGYWSSPDRGLHHLLRAWPEVVKAEPRARLHVFYEIDKYLQLVANAVGEYGSRASELFPLLTLAKQDKTITFHGQVPRLKLAETQLQCRVMCYPLDPSAYVEGFGGSVNQALAAGCLTMLTPIDAFPELYDGVTYWLDKNTLKLKDTLARDLISALHGELPKQRELLNALTTWTPYSWTAAGKQLDAVIRGENWKESGP